MISTIAHSDPDGIRTRVAGVKGQCPRPLDDGAEDRLYSFWRACPSQGGMSNRGCRNGLRQAGDGEGIGWQI